MGFHFAIDLFVTDPNIDNELLPSAWCRAVSSGLAQFLRGLYPVPWGHKFVI